MIYSICVLVCGLGYRWRGGWLHETLPRPGQVSRLTFAAIAALTALLFGAPWQAAAVMVPALWLGAIMPLFGAIDLGRNDGSFWSDFALLLARGALAVVFASAALWWCAAPHWWALLACGPLMAPSYWAGRQWRANLPDLGVTHDDWPPMGEFLFGCCIGAGIILAVSI